MDLADRIAALEERVQRLETRETAAPVPAAEGAFWALEGLKARAPGGGLLFTGSVDLPTGEHYEWQHAQTAEALRENISDYRFSWDDRTFRCCARLAAWIFGFAAP